MRTGTSSSWRQTNWVWKHGFRASKNGLTASAKHPIPVEEPNNFSTQSHDCTAERDEFCSAASFPHSPKLFCFFKFWRTKSFAYYWNGDAQGTLQGARPAHQMASAPFKSHFEGFISQMWGLCGIYAEQAENIYYWEKCKQDFKEQARRLQHTLGGKGRLK